MFTAFQHNNLPKVHQKPQKYVTDEPQSYQKLSSELKILLLGHVMSS